MIQHIIDLLKVVKGDTENIQIAQGKYHLPDSLKKGWQQAIKEKNWK